MSDATLPPPRSPSAAPNATDVGHSSDSNSAVENDFDTSLDQSYDSGAKGDVSSGFEGRAENKQRRKRTSSQDQAILEAEYKQNPKPNKASRAEIVEKVSLNEKEVQIWFQNRRQINRRKSRPLLPHEIAAFGLGGMAALSSDPASMSVFGSQLTGGAGPSLQQDAPGSLPLLKDVTESLDSKASEDAAKAIEPPSRPSSQPTMSQPPTLKQSSSGVSLPEIKSSSISDGVVKSFSSTPGYLANRWNSFNHSFSTPASSLPQPMFTPPITQVAQPASCPERIDENATAPKSRIRLSLSLDGKAELVTGSPSPPHQSVPRPTSSSSTSIPQKRMRTLQRSQSALPFGYRSSLPPATGPFLPSLAPGRSRDARTWASCCDGEVRDELSAQAEQESSGSAIAAISLIRSASNAALKPNANKRNAPSAKHDSTMQGKKPKLSRALSSVARLQNTDIPSKLSPEPSKAGKDGSMQSPSGDSDKENWIPKEGGGNRRRRPLPSSRSNSQVNSRAVLGENHKVLAHANFGGRKDRKRRSTIETNIFEDAEDTAEVGDEVEKFMRGEISPSKKGDLDCIQGLLSLSQGNWR